MDDIENSRAANNSPQSIGICWQEADGTVVLHLQAKAPDGTIGSAILRYPTDHIEYLNILDHVGPFNGTEQKIVAPWPD